MLTTLRIKNLALVSELVVGFEPGYNVITGETGAGKSILIGALNLVLGERADRTMIRSGAGKGPGESSVEAVFEIDRLGEKIQHYLAENGMDPCEEGQLVLRRTLSESGANRQFVNGSPTTLAILAELGQWLVDLHGPHEHQSLLQPARQLAILDAFGGLDRERNSFEELVRRQARLEQEKAALIVDEGTYAKQLDLLRFQVREITEANLQADEEGQVEAEFRRATNVAKLRELVQTSLESLVENEVSAQSLVSASGRALRELSRIDAATAPLLSLQEGAAERLRELQVELGRYLDKLELDQEGTQRLEHRINLIQSVKRKYGATLADVIAFGEEAKRKLESLEGRDAELRRMNDQLGVLENQITRAGLELTARRRKVLPKLAGAVEKELVQLGFLRSHFDISLTSTDPDKKADEDSNSGKPALSGFDTVEFQFAPNPGEPARALRSIASSGELARVMLALKTVLAEVDEVPVLIFDEVDANVGGETANALGEKMVRISRKRQVLCITHLPQVAAPAMAHFVVSKILRKGRTESEIELLNEEDRVSELARMLGGHGAAARKHAEELLQR